MLPPWCSGLNWALSGYRVIHPASWRGVLHHYIPSLHSTVVLDLRTELPTVLLFLMAFVALWASRRTHDEYLQLIRASTAFSIAYLAIVPVYTGFRLELALLPMVAVGVGLPLATLPWQFVRISRADAVVPARRR